MLPENWHTFCIFIRQGQSPMTPIRHLPTDYTNLIRLNHTAFHHHHPILKNIMGKLVKSLDEIQIKIAIICQFHDSQFFWTTTLTDNIQIISTWAYARFCEIPRSTIKTPPLSMPLKKSQWLAGRWLEASNDRSSRIPGSSRAEAWIRAWQLASRVVCATSRQLSNLCLSSQSSVLQREATFQTLSSGPESALLSKGTSCLPDLVPSWAPHIPEGKELCG